MNVYQQNGFRDREDYLKFLSEDYGIMLSNVRLIADMNGPSEDFDALPELLEEYLDGSLDLYDSDP